MLKNITISPAGTCDDCIMPIIGGKTLAKLKKDTLAGLEERLPKEE